MHEANDLNSDKTEINNLSEPMFLHDLIFVDIFAGSAKLSKILKDASFQVLPIDSKFNRHTPAVKCLILDLTRNDHQQLLFDIIKSEHIAGINMGPPCGTSSRARERPLPSWQLKAGAHQPMPLRDAENVRGLPGLSETDQTRVTAANQLYHFCVDLAILCIEQGVPFSIENPKRSWAWDVMTLYAEEQGLSRFHQLSNVDFQHCMYGGTRDKTTTMKFWPAGYLEELELMCDKSHEHAKWGAEQSAGRWEFNTKQEAEYPQGLCEKITDLLVQFWQRKGVVSLVPSVTHHVPTSAKKFKARVAVGKQPRGRSFPALIPEFREVREVSALHKEPGTKVLRLFSKGGESGSQQMQMIGVYHTPEQFVELSLNLLHPMDVVTGLQPQTLDTLHFVLTNSIADVAKHRASMARLLLDRRCALAEQESQLHQSLPSHLQVILKGKNLLLFRELLEQHGYPDAGIVDELTNGFRVTGKLVASKVWARELKPATMSLDEFRQRSVWSNKALSAKCISSGDSAIDDQVWQQTLEEVEKGWLAGPLSLDQMQSKYAEKNWCASRRFPVVQGQKLRLIDDAKESCLNDTVTVVNKLELMDTDHMLELALLAESLIRARDFSIPYPDGKITAGTVHSDFCTQDFEWVGRTLDLKSAYKQLGHHSDDIPHTIIAVYSPVHGSPMFFESSALLFGSTASVYTFNRVARALWFLLNTVMKVLTLQFYDDYPMLDCSLSAKSTKASAEFLLDVLGFQYAKDGSKNLPFESLFTMLGVEVDLSKLRLGTVVVRNKPQRVQDMLDQLNKFVQSGKLSLNEAQSIRGKLQFMQGQYLTKSLKPSLHVLDRYIASNCSPDLMEMLCHAIVHASVVLNTAGPKEVNLNQTKVPICVLTDGAYEPQEDGSFLATHGAVVIDPLTGVRFCHDGIVPPALLALWRDLVGDQLIGQVELFPVIALRIKYSSMFAGRRILYFIDNDSARDALIRGSSKSIASFALLSMFFQQEEVHPSFPWFCRVPSSSNPADPPSRGDVASVVKEFNLKYEGPLFLQDCFMERLLQTKTLTDLISN